MAKIRSGTTIKDAHRAEQYHYSVGWSEEDGVYIGRVAEFPSLAAHGKTLSSAFREIQKVVQAVLEDLAESGEPIPEPFSKRKYSGKLNLRLPAYLHRQLAIEAAQQGISLNQLITLKAETK
jgi:predicted RNase H-like HicB family nuclease